MLSNELKADLLIEDQNPDLEERLRSADAEMTTRALGERYGAGMPLEARVVALVKTVMDMNPTPVNMVAALEIADRFVNDPLTAGRIFLTVADRLVDDAYIETHDDDGEAVTERIPVSKLHTGLAVLEAAPLIENDAGSRILSKVIQLARDLKEADNENGIILWDRAAHLRVELLERMNGSKPEICATALQLLDSRWTPVWFYPWICRVAMDNLPDDVIACEEILLDKGLLAAITDPEILAAATGIVIDGLLTFNHQSYEIISEIHSLKVAIANTTLHRTGLIALRPQAWAERRKLKAANQSARADKARFKDSMTKADSEFDLLRMYYMRYIEKFRNWVSRAHCGIPLMITETGQAHLRKFAAFCQGNHELVTLLDEAVREANHLLESQEDLPFGKAEIETAQAFIVELDLEGIEA